MNTARHRPSRAAATAELPIREAGAVRGCGAGALGFRRGINIFLKIFSVFGALKQTDTLNFNINRPRQSGEYGMVLPILPIAGRDNGEMEGKIRWRSSPYWS